MIKTTDIDDMELKIEINEEFYVSKCEYEEFKKKLECLINEYRI